MKIIMRSFQTAVSILLITQSAGSLAVDLDIYAIDVGQGDSTLVLGPEINGTRRALLMDAGDNRFVNGAAIVDAVLDDLGVTALDFVVLSHYDADHMGGFVTVGNGRQSLLWIRTGALTDPTCTLLGRMPSREIIDVGEPIGSSQSRIEWRACVDQLTGGSDEPIHVEIDGSADVDRNLDLGGGVTAIVVTGRGFVIDQADQVVNVNTPNEFSIALLVSTPAGFDILITGDLIGRPHGNEDAEIEDALGEALEDRDVDIEVLRIGHHGAENATASNFLSHIKPEVAVVSVGNENHQGDGWNHPTCGALERLRAANIETVLQTEPGNSVCTAGMTPATTTVANGTIHISVDGPKYSIGTFGDASPITGVATDDIELECTLTDGCNQAGGGFPFPQPPAQCCRMCVTSQACGDSCISWDLTCRRAPGCACQANP